MGTSRPSLAALVALALLVPAGSAMAKPGDAPEPRERARAQTALGEAQRLLDGRGVRTGRELTTVLAELAATRDALPAAERREARAVLARPTDATDPQDHEYSVAEEAPYCTTSFCIHYVASTGDAPSLADGADAGTVPDYVEAMAGEFETSYAVENGTLGWTTARSDGTLGGDSRTDVYIKDIGDEGIFGYAAPEAGSGSSYYSYLVMDDDYVEFAPTTPTDALRVTAAHEYNHVLQFTYDAFQDVWMFEASATWAEEKVYPAINDYLNYLGTWAACSESPLTADARSTACELKKYGSAVWNHWVDARYGDDVVRRAWELGDVTTPQPHFAPDAYDESIAADAGAGFADEFARFSAAVAEWRAPGSAFPDSGSYPEVERVGSSLAIDGAARTVQLDHTTFTLIDVTPDSSKALARLQAVAPAGLNAAIALVGRTGSSPSGGTVTTAYQRLAGGRTGSVQLDNPGSFGRITAVLVNADPSFSGYDSTAQDWIWTRDNQDFQNVRVLSTAGGSSGGGGTGTGGSTTTGPTQPTVTPPTPLVLAASAVVARRQRVATLLRRGVLVRGRCNRSCRIRFELRLDRATARRLRLPRVVGARSVSLTRAGSRSLRVRLSRRARSLVRSGRLKRVSVRMRATSGAQRSALVSRRVSVRR